MEDEEAVAALMEAETIDTNNTSNYVWMCSQSFVAVIGIQLPATTATLSVVYYLSLTYLETTWVSPTLDSYSRDRSMPVIIDRNGRESGPTNQQ